MASRSNANNILKATIHLNKKERLAALTNARYSKSGAYKVLKTGDDNGEVVDKRKFNGSTAKITGTRAGALIGKFNNSTHQSLRKTAKLYNVCHKTISNTLKRHGVACYKRRIASMYKPGSKCGIHQTLGELYRQHLTSQSNVLPFIVMDDETYITQNDECKFSSKYVYTKDIKTTPEEIRYSALSKFPFKVGLWYAMSDHGISDFFIWDQGVAIDAKTYKTHCMQKRLVPFIQKHYPKGNYIFWPDKASAHYSKSVLNYLTSKQINVVPKLNNPTNVPQCRPIELQHADIKRRVFADKFQPKNSGELKEKLCQIMNQLLVNAPPLCSNFSTNVRVLCDKAY